MAFKTADFDSSILPYKIIHDTALSGSSSGTATTRVDMTNGESGFLYSMALLNGSSAAVFLKMTFAEATVTLGTTNADLMIKIPASTQVEYTMPEGIDFTNLSMWCVTSGAVAGTTAPGGSVLVTLVTS